MADFGVPTSGQLDKINALAKRTLSKDEVFAFSTKMVGDALLEDRLMQLHKTLLEVYKADARTGVAFMLDHAWSGMQKALVYGRTFDSSLKKSDGSVEGEKWALHGDTYVVRGKEKDGISTDSIIADIEDGTLFDVSIGFGFENAVCSICGNNYYKYSECEHWRGQEYDGQLCYIIAKPPGYLMELSGVFDGAYPTAGVLSQVGLSEGKSDFVQLPDEELKKLPSGIMTYASYGSASGKLLTYHKKDDLVKGNAFNVGGLITSGCLNAADLHIGTVIPRQFANDIRNNLQSLSSLKGSDQKVSEDLLKMLTGLGITVAEGAEAPASDTVLKILSEKWQKENPPAELEFTAEYMTQAQVVEKLGKELPAEKVLSYAKEGETYRNELIEEALKAGVRAQADAFKKETWERNFDLLSIQDIKDTMDTWSKQAGEEIPSGRQSSAGAGQNAVTQSELPDEAFQA